MYVIVFVKYVGVVQVIQNWFTRIPILSVFRYKMMLQDVFGMRKHDLINEYMDRQS